MKFLNYLSVVCLCLASPLSRAQETPEAPSAETSVRSNEADETYRNAKTEFAFRLLQATAQERGDENFFVSPLGASAILEALILGSNGETRAELEAAAQTTNFENERLADAGAVYRSLAAKSELRFVDGVWIQSGYEVEPRFLEATSKLAVDRVVQNVDFADANSTNAINRWIEEKTDGKIVSFLEPQSPETRLILANALVFQGRWESAFDPKRTTDAAFTTLDGTKTTTPTMRRHGKFRLFYGENFDALEAPYEGKRFSAWFLLPPRDKDFREFVCETTAARFDECRREARVETVEFQTPKFDLESKLSLVPALQALGVEAAFTDAADFGKISTGAELTVSDVAQAVRVKTDEAGTEAAASTLVSFMVKSVSASFCVDRPFLFAIVDNETDAILFAGQIVKPTE